MSFLQRIYTVVQKDCTTIDAAIDVINDGFKSNSYVTSPIDETALTSPVKFIGKYLNNTTITNAIKNNSNIEKILKENGLNVEYDITNVTEIIMSHLIPTAKVTRNIYSKVINKKNKDNLVHLVQAALLHDIGKVFIPKEILNKKGKLSLKERAIIELHNKLSYEILKTTDLNEKVAKFALEHHDYDNNIIKTPENQSLTVADIYCALRESRPYKKPLNDLGAKTILYDMGAKGKFDIRYISLIN